MSIILWALAGGAIGWAGIALMKLNEGRGTAVSIVIGAIGGLIGGNMLAPVFSGPASVTGAFDFAALFIAAASAAVLLAVGNLIHARYGV